MTKTAERSIKGTNGVRRMCKTTEVERPVVPNLQKNLLPARQTRTMKPRTHGTRVLALSLAS